MSGPQTAKAGTDQHPAILTGIGRGDSSAVRDCVVRYGNFIWALAERITESREEAEAATLTFTNDLVR